MDVLKEMSDCVQLLCDEGNIHSSSGLDDARDAVAELIEAANAVSEACVKHYGYGIDLHIALTGKGGKNERLLAALSRVRGQ